HPVVRLPHVPTGVWTGTPRRLAHLVDEHLPQPRDVCPRELPVDPVIACTACRKGIDDRGDRIETAWALIQRSHFSPLDRLLKRAGIVRRRRTRKQGLRRPRP